MSADLMADLKASIDQAAHPPVVAALVTDVQTIGLAECWAVTSSDGGGIYVVGHTPLNLWFCGCPAGSRGKTCRHIQLAKNRPIEPGMGGLA